MASERVRLSPELAREKERFLTTFYGKVVDSRAPRPILGDTFAAQAAARIDLDFDALRIPEGSSITLPLRAKHLDGWAREFLATHPTAVVLHLGCGLDSRVFRVDPPPTVTWYDVDRPEVIALRERVYPEREGYSRIAASLTDPAWLEQVPAGRPVLVVAEGVVMYLTEADGAALFRRITGRFPSGQLVFDAYSSLIIRSLNLAARLKRQPLALSWAFADPRALEAQVPGLRLVTETPFLTLPELTERLGATQSAVQRRISAAMMRTRTMQRSIRHLRYAF